MSVTRRAPRLQGVTLSRLTAMSRAVIPRSTLDPDTDEASALQATEIAVEGLALCVGLVGLGGPEYRLNGSATIEHRQCDG